MTGTMQTNAQTFAALQQAKLNAVGVAEWLVAETAFEKFMATLPTYEQMALQVKK